jgi:hypothetical protein
MGRIWIGRQERREKSEERRAKSEERILRAEALSYMVGMTGF